jgi:hypothetical protein
MNYMITGTKIYPQNTMNLQPDGPVINYWCGATTVVDNKTVPSIFCPIQLFFFCVGNMCEML